MNTIREVAITKQVPIVDFDSRLHDLCRSEHGHACLGNEYFLDHVHPTVDVHRRLALWIIETLQKDQIVAGLPFQTLHMLKNLRPFANPSNRNSLD